MKLKITLLSILIVFVSFSCRNDNTIQEQVNPLPTNIYYPPLVGKTWETIAPEKLGWDISKLNDAIDFVANNNSSAFIILWKGRIVVEKYWLNTNDETSNKIFSATKSMSAFLVGLAQEQGKLNINDKVNQYLGNGWSNENQAQESQITIKQLITMTSGLGDNLGYDAPAGSKWYYNTVAYHKIYDVLSAAYNQTNTQYTQQQLWSKIGMQNSFWDTEPGNGPTMSCSGRDMARFGLLIQSNGKWDGTTIMNDSNYFQNMTNTSQNFNQSYGYYWWLNGKNSYMLPGSSGTIFNGSLFPNAPNDLIAALGHGDKKIYVCKSKDLVVIRHGMPSNYPVTYALSDFDNILWTKLSAAIH